MEGSSSLIWTTMGIRRLTARSLLVPKTFAMTEFNKTGCPSWAQIGPVNSVNGSDAGRWRCEPASATDAKLTLQAGLGYSRFWRKHMHKTKVLAALLALIATPALYAQSGDVKRVGDAKSMFSS